MSECVVGTTETILTAKRRALNMKALKSFFAFMFITSLLQFPNSYASPAPVKLLIQYANGLPADSSADRVPSVLVDSNGSRIHLVIRNTSQTKLVLRKQSCSTINGVRFEFKLNASDEKVLTARRNDICTVITAIPDTFVLSPDEEYIYEVNFSEFWDFPSALDGLKGRIIYMRAVYMSEPADIPYDPNSKNVWLGNVSTEWEQVKLTNRIERSRLHDRRNPAPPEAAGR